MTQLIISRPKQWTNWRFAYKVLLNGKEVTQIINGEEKIISFAEPSTIEAKLGLAKSNKFDLQNSDIIHKIRIKANTWTNSIVPIFLALLISINVYFRFTNAPAGATNFIEGMLLGVIFSIILLLTFARDKFLTIEVIK